MQCKCSLNNNYQVIDLCDIENFNQKISKFADKSWTQIIIPEKLTIPKEFPDLESISKIYLDINITYTKIINTPKPQNENIEGLTLTGKTLLVSGCLCQTIIYISNTYYKSMHSVKFSVPFNTYIIINEDDNIENDTYYVYPCIENLSVTPLTKRTLNKSVTLFLFAHKITPLVPPVPPPPTINITNTFIFKSAFDNTEIATVSFDSLNKKLIVTSTGTPYDLPGSDIAAFKFELLKSVGKAYKVSSSAIKSNEGADNFKTRLNNIKFEIDDLIILKFSDRSKVLLTGYPNKSEVYNMIAKNNESQGFKITRSGIIPYLLINKVLLNGDGNSPVVTIQFDILTRKILCKAQGDIASSGGPNYFKMTLYNSNETNIKKVASIAGFHTGSFFSNIFNSISFHWQDVIKLEYEDSTKVVVTNFSSITGTEIKIRITELGLIDV